MFCTHVGDEGARAIREAIQGNKGTKLASLNMAGNKHWSSGSKVCGGHGDCHGDCHRRH
jgi:hypothetical protein